MNIKIITIHAMHNPGSVFQAYALQKFLESNHKVEIIDYRPSYFYSEGSKLKLFFKKLLWGKVYQSRNKKFIGFIEKNLCLTSKYESYESLQQANLEADAFVTGSDQLWNTDFPCGNDESFYLSFVKSGKKIAYSTSVGKREIDAANMDVLKKHLETFDAISVREKSTAEQLQIALKQHVSWVCDPVFLLPASSYEKFVTKENPIGKKYAMVYLLGTSEKLDMIVQFYKTKGLYIVLAGGFTKRCKCDLHIKDVGPEDFLNLIYHAEVVISSSFHATAFCHIFHKDFLTFLPLKNGERIVNLLNVSDLLERSLTVKGPIDFKKLEKTIDWKSVNLSVEKYVEFSKLFLKKEL